ncbi:hypothetical protein PLESTM_002039700 [Pleodorina starrii]|nr:hypothetical protein PLESTM_002039700 [Pleodorina starrii]
MDDKDENQETAPHEGLTFDLVLRLGSFLPAAELVCTLRLLNKAAAKSIKNNFKLRLSQPVPHHAFVRRWGSDAGMRDLTLQLRRRLLILTARSGSLANLQVAAKAAGCLLVREVFDAAAAAGHTDVCEWLLEQDCPHGPETVAAAAAGGHLTLVRWLLQLLHRQHPSPAAAAAAAAAQEAAWVAACGAGQRALCAGLLADGIPPSAKAPLAAARSGHVGLVHWLLALAQLTGSAIARVDKRELLRNAAFGCDLPSLQRLLRCAQRLARCSPNGGEPLRDPPQADRALGEALCSPTPDWHAKLQWLASVEAEAPERAGAAGREPRRAALDPTMMGELLKRRGSWRQRLDLAWQHRCGVTSGEVALAAIASCNLPVLWHQLQQSLWVPRSKDMQQVAWRGDLALLKVLLGMGGRLSWEVVEAAARGGRLELLRWLAEATEAERHGGAAAFQEALVTVGRGGLLAHAARSGSLELVEWLVARGCCPEEAEEALEEAAESGCGALLERLAAWGCPLGSTGEAYVRAGRNGDFATLNCLRRLGCPWGPLGATFRAAIESGCGVAVLTWLVSEGCCPVDWQAAARQARDRALARRDAESWRVVAWVEGQSGAAEASVQLPASAAEI